MKNNKNQKIISLFEMVRDIPYDVIDSREASEVLEKKKGTCSGKHLLLGKLFELIDIEVKYMMCLTKFNFIQNSFPDKLTKMLDKEDIFDYHNFLKIKSKSKWILVDATFDLPLKDYGVPVNSYWDGLSNCKIALQPIKIYTVSNLSFEKQNAIDRLSKEQQQKREVFIKKMCNWFNEIRG